MSKGYFSHGFAEITLGQILTGGFPLLRLKIAYRANMSVLEPFPEGREYEIIKGMFPELRSTFPAKLYTLKMPYQG